MRKKCSTALSNALRSSPAVLSREGLSDLEELELDFSRPAGGER